MTLHHRIVFFFFSFLLIIFSVSAQTEKVKQISPEGDTIVLEAIPLNQVSASLEKDHNLLQELEERLKHDPEIDVFDSVFEDKSAFLQQQKTQFNKEKENFSEREVNNSINEWNTYEKNVTGWKEKINSHLSIIEKDLYTLNTQKKLWELTSTEARKSEAPKSVMESIGGMLERIKKDERSLTELQNNMLRRQNEISKVMLSVIEVISENKEIKKQLQSDILTLDSPPIWQAADSSLSAKVLKEYFSKASDDNIRGVRMFFESNTRTIYFQVFLFILILIAFYFLKKQTLISTDDENEAEIEKARVAISQYGLSALVVTMFLSIWLYPEPNSTIADFHQLLYLLAAIFFLPAYIDKKLRLVLYQVLLLFLLSQQQIFFPREMLFSRFTLFLKIILAAWIIFKIIEKKGLISRELVKNKLGFVIPLMKFFMGLLLVSFIGNVIGNLSFSILLCNAVVESVFNFTIVLLMVIILNRTFIVLMRTKFVRRSNYINKYWQLVEKRLRAGIYILAVFLWLKSILNSLSLLDPLKEWLGKIVQTSWRIGENNTIEFGGIIRFFLALVLTFIMVRIIKTLLEEELFPRVKLPRGVPGAVSMIVGYIFTAYGIYLALSVAGVDLGKFGLIAGALGVGIGFGLQNIVSNFIAGLILAFERPIQVGDTIEAGAVMGDVKAIGVRACTIRTFDGSEVMIPNGNLIANDVINWTLSDRKKRRDIFVSVAYGSNPHEVLDLIKKVATDHPNVLHLPVPWALFDGFGDSALNFRVRIWTAMDVGLTTKSEVAMGIYDALAEAGIEIPFPQQDLHVKSFDPTIRTTQHPANDDNKNKNDGN
ncbi:MAG: mechanosensitive ion channel [Bacteroidales bacterium]|nr:mechanosensitive ion channel [Bacteroidales bacterium]